MVCRLVPFFMPWKHGYGSLLSTYERRRMKVFIEELLMCENLFFRCIELEKVLCYYNCIGALEKANDA